MSLKFGKGNSSGSDNGKKDNAYAHLNNLADTPGLNKLGKTNMTLQEFLTLWRKAKSNFHYPTLNDPIPAAPPGGVGGSFNFGTRETHIDPEFAAMLEAKTGMKIAEGVEAINNHEIGHYMHFPRNLANITMGIKFMLDFCRDTEKKNAGFQSHVWQTYCDMANDTECVLEPGTRASILGVREATQKVMVDPLRLLMLNYLRYQSSGTKPAMEKEMAKIFEKMLSIDFVGAKSNPQAMREGIFVWMEVVREMMQKYPPKKGKGDGGQGQGQCECEGECDGQGSGQGTSKGKGSASQNQSGESGSGEEFEIKDAPISAIKDASKADMRDALSQIRKLLTKGEFDRLRNLVRQMRNEPVPKNPPSIGIGLGGNDKLEVSSDTVEYYRELAKNYPIAIIKKPIKTNDMRKSFGSTEKFRMGGDPNLMLPSSSGGRILPGLTRKIQIIERPRTTVKYDTPHALILIDSSGSMGNPDPAIYKSPMVLAAVCAVLSYHKLGSKVGVINFSGSSFYLSYTRDLEQALAAVVAYQGGGTEIDMELVRKMLGEEAGKLLDKDDKANLDRILSKPEFQGIVKAATKKNVSIGEEAIEKMLDAKSIDMLLFSDLGIANLGELLELCQEKAMVNRIAVISNSDAKEIGEFDKVGKIRVYDKIASIEDMVKITVGGITDSVRTNANLAGFDDGRRSIF